MGLSEHGIFGVDTVYPMFEEAYIMLLFEYPYDANFLIWLVMIGYIPAITANCWLNPMQIH